MDGSYSTSASRHGGDHVKKKHINLKKNIKSIYPSTSLCSQMKMQTVEEVEVIVYMRMEKQGTVY